MHVLISGCKSKASRALPLHRGPEHVAPARPSNEQPSPPQGQTRSPGEQPPQDRAFQLHQGYRQLWWLVVTNRLGELAPGGDPSGHLGQFWKCRVIQTIRVLLNQSETAQSGQQQLGTPFADGTVACEGDRIGWISVEPRQDAQVVGGREHPKR